MDITVTIPSRSRVRGLSALLHGMKFLESGRHRVHYGIACDDDDMETVNFCADIKKYMHLGYSAQPRRPTLGDAFNEMAMHMPAQVYCMLNDDMLVLSDNWDECVAKAVEETPHGVFWWSSAGPQFVLIPIITEKWRAAQGGLFTSFFPFWYDDLCLAELWTMTTDADNIVLPIQAIDKPRTITTRMRELTFWQQVYNATRPLRVKQAYDMAEKLGLPRPQCPEHLLVRLNEHVGNMSAERLDQIEANQGDREPPDEAYKAQKAKVLQMFPHLEAFSKAA